MLRVRLLQFRKNVKFTTKVYIDTNCKQDTHTNYDIEVSRMSVDNYNAQPSSTEERQPLSSLDSIRLQVVLTLEWLVKTQNLL
jgi:hypothetical protein